MTTQNESISRTTERLSTKLMGVYLTALIAALVAVTVTATQLLTANRTLGAEQRALAIARLFSATLAPHLETMENAALVEHLRDALAEPQLAYASVRAADDNRVVASAARHSGARVEDAVVIGDFVGTPELKSTFDTVAWPTTARELLESRERADVNLGTLFEASAPIVRSHGGAKKDLLGVLYVGFYGEPTVLEGRRDLVLLLGLATLLTAVIAAVGWWITRRNLAPLAELSGFAVRVAGGNLKQELPPLGDDEVGQVAESFNNMVRGIRAVLSQMKEASEHIEASASEILSAATQQSAGATEQAASISETGATVREINQTAAQTAEKANTVIDVSQRSEEISVVGQKAVEESIAGIEELRGQVEAIAENIIELAERTQQIGEIITTVNDLAEQSNLLALNASIEAAKAGEQGKGFAVVAVEMRNLAEQSKQATAQVRTILSDIQRATRAAVAVTEEGSRKAELSVTLANTSGENIRSLAAVIKESSLAAKQIAVLASQQSVGIEQISTAMTNIKHSTNESVAGTKQIERALQDMKSLSDRLSTIVNRYEM